MQVWIWFKVNQSRWILLNKSFLIYKLKMALKLVWKRPIWTIFRRKGAPEHGESENRHGDVQNRPEWVEKRDFRFDENADKSGNRPSCVRAPKARPSPGPAV